MVKFKFSTSSSDILILVIYIPIWLNSNPELYLPLLPQCYLHSNMVKFKCNGKRTETHLHRNLHSNMVKFKLQPALANAWGKLHLHSNMVKFKCGLLDWVWHYISFTFQYG